MTRLWERLYLGSLADSERLMDSNRHGITTVITLSKSPVSSKRHDVNYIHIPVEDAKAVSVGRFDAVMDTIAENIRWGTVLVQSDKAGNTALNFAAAWMAAVGYKNIDGALVEIRQLHPFMTPSRTLLSSIRRNLQ
ncbi:MAG: hypothetical protein V4555_14970 [Acidobacteriota bacterium]